MRNNKKTKKKSLTKRMYVYLAFVTMAAVSLFAKPIKQGFGALKKHLTQASAKANLRRDLAMYAKEPNHPQKSPFVSQQKKR